MGRFKEKYIGDRAFYKKVLLMVVPMILQSLVTNLVSLIDNIMVGQIGTEQMSGVSIVNQFIFVFNITVFGSVSGPSIFGAQFFGKGDSEGQKHTFRFRLLVCAGITVLGMLILGLFDDMLITLFLSEKDSPEVRAATLGFGKSYMRIMLMGLIPFSIGQAYSSAVRECGETKIPMIASCSAVGLNILLDYALIFGRLGMPKLGVEGAAIATVISKLIEAAVVMVWVHTHHQRNRYIIGAYRSFAIPRQLTVSMTKKGLPLLFNEFLWSAGMAVIAQCYSVRGLDVVAARNISSTMTNLFSSIYIQLGACIAILVGSKLGAGQLREAVSLDDKLRFFSVAVTVVTALAVLPLAAVFPNIYNTTTQVRSLASYMIIIQACAMPLWAYTNACYFTIRSGGRTGLTFLFDFGFTWLMQIPLAIVLSYLTAMDIRLIFALVTFSELVKSVIGFFMVKSGIWVNNIVGAEDPGELDRL